MANVSQTTLLGSKSSNTLNGLPYAAPVANQARLPLAPAAAPAKAWKLTLDIGADRTRSVSIEFADQLSIGRADQMENYLPGLDLTPFGAQDAGVSRRHATIFTQGSALLIRDLGSTNGTSLNGYALEGHKTYRLGDGDEIEFGQLHIRLRIVRQPG